MYIDLQMRVWSSNMRQIGAAQSAPFNHANRSSVYPHISNLREHGKYSVSAVYPWHLVGSIRISCCLVVGHDLLPNGPAFPLVFPPCLLRLSVISSILFKTIRKNRRQPRGHVYRSGKSFLSISSFSAELSEVNLSERFNAKVNDKRTQRTASEHTLNGPKVFTLVYHSLPSVC